MFESLKTLWKKEQNPLQDYDQQSRQLAEEIARLEGELQRQPDNSDVQKNIDVDLQPGIIGICQK